MSGSGRVQKVTGSLEPYAAGFAEFLAGRGYSPYAVRLRLWLADHVSRWLGEEQLDPGDLTPARARQFTAERRARGYRTWTSPQSLGLLLEYLQAIGVVVPAGPCVPASAAEELLGAYRRYLVAERGLAGCTVEYYVAIARLFTSAQSGPDGQGLAGLTAGQVTVFVGRECAGRSIASAKYMVAGLRSFLRYLHVSGQTATALAAAVPGVAGHRGASLPRGLEAAQIAGLLASCDRRSPAGLRDYAILTVLARLGLRVSEVAGLRVDDLDWHRGELTVRGKGNQHEQMPLPADVGEALAGYLRGGRPQGPGRSLFLKVIAPAGPMTPGAVATVVHAACLRAGIRPVGAHRLRHTAGTGLLRAGGSLAEVAQVLRHRGLGSTVLYAKVDRAALRALAPPWPGSTP